MGEKFTTIRIHIVTKSKLDRVIGEVTYSTWLDQVLTYQEVTNTDFKKIQEFPATVMIKEMVKLTAIVRAIEKDKLVPILAGVNSIAGGNLHRPSDDVPNTTGVTIEELQQAVAINERLNNDLEEIKKENSDLRTKNRLLQEEKGKPAEDKEEPEIDLRKAAQLIEHITTLHSKNNFTGDLQFNPTTFYTWLDSLKKSLKL